jgi:hypothetical protein
VHLGAKLRGRARRGSKDFLCLITPLRSYLYGGLYGGLYERAHIIRCFLWRAQVSIPMAATEDATTFYSGRNRSGAQGARLNPLGLFLEPPGPLLEPPGLLS